MSGTPERGTEQLGSLSLGLHPTLNTCQLHALTGALPDWGQKRARQGPPQVQPHPQITDTQSQSSAGEENTLLLVPLSSAWHFCQESGRVEGIVLLESRSSCRKKEGVSECGAKG